MPIISQIYSYVNYSYAFHLKRVLFTVSQPLITMIRQWVLYGELTDYSGEFFVRIHPKIKDDEIWDKRYEFIFENLPIFAEKEFYLKIFGIGKCVNFIKRYCNFPNFSLNAIEIKNRLFLEEETISDLNINKNELIKEQNKILEQNLTSLNIQKQAFGKVDINKMNQNQIKEEINALNVYNDNKNKIKEIESSNFVNNSTKSNNISDINKLTRFIIDKQKLNLEKIVIKKPLKLIFNKEPFNVLNDLPDFKREIDLIYKEINKYLVELLFNEFYLEDHFKSIFNYLLLGQGDMMQYLMELLINELNKNANFIQEHFLRSRLDTAISVSNAQFDKFRHNVSVKLNQFTTGDNGWDIFMLQYKVSLPLCVIFNDLNMSDYQRLFVFFWKLKRLEFTNDHEIWHKFMNQSHIQGSGFDKYKKYIHRALLFNQQIIHFVSTLHNYITLEVLENHTKKLKLKIRGAKSLDEVIKYHNEFIKDVSEQSLMTEEYNLVYTNIIQVFEVIFRYKMAVDVLSSTLIDSYIEDKKRQRMLYNDDEIDNDYDQTIRFSIEAFNQIKDLFEEYKVRVSGLIKTLENVRRGNFKNLAMKLDFNYYYSDLESKMIQKEFKGDDDEGNDFNDGNDDDNFNYGDNLNNFNDIKNVKSLYGNNENNYYNNKYNNFDNINSNIQNNQSNETFNNTVYKKATLSNDIVGKMELNNNDNFNESLKNSEHEQINDYNMSDVNEFDNNNSLEHKDNQSFINKSNNSFNKENLNYEQHNDENQDIENDQYYKLNSSKNIDLDNNIDKSKNVKKSKLKSKIFHDNK